MEGVGAYAAPLSEDDGYVSPEFDLPSESESEEETRPAKRSKKTGSTSPPSTSDNMLDNDEKLALALLRGSR